MQDDTSTVTELKETIRQFVDEREWRQFHTPKDSGRLSIEAAELLEHFRFRSNEEIEELLKRAQRQAIGHELADVLLVLLICEQLDMDASTLLRREDDYFSPPISRGESTWTQC